MEEKVVKVVKKAENNTEKSLNAKEKIYLPEENEAREITNQSIREEVLAMIPDDVDLALLSKMVKVLQIIKSKDE